MKRAAERRALLACAVVVALALPVVSAPSARAGVPGDDVLARFECTRCHVIAGVGAPSLTKSCVDCHVHIENGTIAKALGQKVDDATAARWRDRVVHFLDVPSLDGLDKRVRRSWLESYLARPHDLRPGLSESMPRLPLSPEDARRIALRLIPTEPDGRALPSTSKDGGGRALFETKGCALCHRFSGVDVVARGMPEVVDGTKLSGITLEAAVRHAPDLKYARERMTPRSIVAWLESPRSIKHDARMPRIAMSRAEAESIAQWIVDVPLAPAVAAAANARLPLLSRRVAFDEVFTRVFAKSCRHCHADPALAFGDGGPGNTGGFGYRGRGLSFASDEEIAEGSLDDDGERRSIFAPLERGPLAGTPRLVAHLLARRSEERGQPIEGVLGMPLALPSLDDEQLQLVESWIAQGRPR